MANAEVVTEPLNIIVAFHRQSRWLLQKQESSSSFSTFYCTHAHVHDVSTRKLEPSSGMHASFQNRLIHPFTYA